MMLFLSVASIIIIVIDNHAFHVGDWWTVFVVQHVKIGDIYDNSKVVRVDRGLGLLLEVPSIPEPTPAFVSVRSVWTSFNVTKLLQYEIWMFNYITITIKPYPTRQNENDHWNYCWQISDIAEEIPKLEKKYKEGNHVRVRILGLRYLEGIATGVLKVVIVLLLNLISKRW